MLRVSGRRSATLTLLAVAAVTSVPLWVSSYWLFIATSAVIASFTALSIGIVYGRVGMISLCQLSFGAVGVWFVAWLNQQGVVLPVPVMILIGGLVAVPAGIIVGIPALRLRGVNIAIVTLGVATVVDTVLNLRDFPGELQGVLFERSAPFVSESSYYWLCWAVLLVAVGLVVVLGRQPLGGGWLAARHSERAAAALGMNTVWSKLSAFGFSAFLAGMGGAMLLIQLGSASPRAFATLPSMVAFTLAVLFGARFPEGAMFAGAASVLAPELLRRIGLSADIGSMLFALGTIHALRKGKGLAEVLRARASRRRAESADRQAAEVAAAAQGVASERLAGAVDGAAGRSEGGAPLARADEPVLVLKGITVRYGSVTALDNVDLSLKDHSVGALIGPNGAGKTTLVDVVAGFIRRYEGSIVLGGSSIDRLDPARRARAGLRRTFQQGLAVPELTVRSYLELSAHRRMSSAELDELLAFVNGPRSDRLIADVDVGTRRLIEVAAGLSAAPRVLLLDEPGAGLAAEESVRLARRICAIPERFGCGVLLIEHDMTMVQEACTEVTALDFGRVIATGAVSDVLGHADVVTAYLGAQKVLT